MGAVEGRRIARVVISESVVGALFTPGHWVKVAKGLPEDATYTGATLDPERNVVNLFFVSESFDQVPDGERPPEVDVTFSISYEERRNP